MLFHHIITILRCWICVNIVHTKSIANIDDQISMASEGFVGSNLKIENFWNGSNAEIHYANSNGFVPTVDSNTSIPFQLNNDSWKIKNKLELQESKILNSTSNRWDTNSILSAEARLLLTLPNAASSRRSFDYNQRPRRFEILKVTNETPAVANYHEFQENLLNNHHSQKRNYPEVNPVSKAEERIKIINGYLNVNVDTRSKNQNYYYQHRKYPSNINQQEDELKKTPIFESEKVKNNYQQYDTTTTDEFYKRDSALRIRTDAHTFQKYDQKHSEDRYDSKADYSDQNSDYSERFERPPKRVQERRRRPYSKVISKDLPTEHRYEGVSEKFRKNDSHGRIKSHGHIKLSHWTEEQHRSTGDNISEEEIPNGHRESSNNQEKDQNYGKVLNKAHSWNQITPNIEFSKANDFEIGQLNNSNYMIPNLINFNLTPMNNFNQHIHENKQAGFNLVNKNRTTPIVGTTMTSFVRTIPPIILQKVSPESIFNNSRYTNVVPEIIIGQNSYQHAVQAVLLPQMNINNKYTSSIKTPYITSTISPIFRIAQEFTPTVQAIQSTPIPKILKTRNQYGTQLFFPQTPSNIIDYNYFTESENHRAHSTTFRKSNISILPSPNLSIDQEVKSQKENRNTHNKETCNHEKAYNNNSNNIIGHNANRYNNTQNDNQHIPLSRTNNQQFSQRDVQTHAYPLRRGTKLVPTIVQDNIDMNLINQASNHVSYSQSPMSQSAPIVHIPKKFNQPQPINIASYSSDNSWQQKSQINEVDDLNYKFQSFDSPNSVRSTRNGNANTASTAKIYNNGDHGHLPVVGMQNVEIKNSAVDIKPSPLDLTVDNGIKAMNSYPTAILTTPIPILSTTTGFITGGQIITNTNSVPNYVNSLARIEYQNNQQFKQLDMNPVGESTTFNPMNFIPNWDLIKSQKLLNHKEHIPKPLFQHLELIPALRGGNFERHSSIAQMNLVKKPKLSSDLEKYAEEMFKESLRTIYNTHKWNSEKKVINLTETDIAKLEKLRSDLNKLKTAMVASSYGKDILEAHRFKTNFKTVESGRNTKPSVISAATVATIEELIKSDFQEDESSENYNFFQNGKSNRIRSKGNRQINDYLTPPKINSLITKNSYFDQIGKKHPLSKGLKLENVKSWPKINNHPTSTLEPSASNQIIYSQHRPYHERNLHRQYKISRQFDNHTAFTAASPSIDVPTLFSDNQPYRDTSTSLDFSHPKTHNLVGWFMKNKQLPSGVNSHISSNEEDMNL